MISDFWVDRFLKIGYCLLEIGFRLGKVPKETFWKSSQTCKIQIMYVSKLKICKCYFWRFTFRYWFFWFHTYKMTCQPTTYTVSRLVNYSFINWTWFFKAKSMLLAKSQIYYVQQVKYHYCYWSMYTLGTKTGK